jgi:hypothetical protein
MMTSLRSLRFWTFRRYKVGRDQTSSDSTPEISNPAENGDDLDGGKMAGGEVEESELLSWTSGEKIFLSDGVLKNEPAKGVAKRGYSLSGEEDVCFR